MKCADRRTDRAAVLHAGAARKGEGVDTCHLHLELRQSGEFCWFALSGLNFFVSGGGCPDLTKETPGTTRYTVLYNLEVFLVGGGESNCCLYVG